MSQTLIQKVPGGTEGLVLWVLSYQRGKRRGQVPRPASCVHAHTHTPPVGSLSFLPDPLPHSSTPTPVFTHECICLHTYVLKCEHAPK